MREILFRGQRFDNGEWLYGAVAAFRNVANEIYTAIIPDVDGENCMMDLKRVDSSTSDCTLV
ncbi:MAG: hypothetical protein ACI4PO_09200 [Faecousia sp.]